MGYDVNRVVGVPVVVVGGWCGGRAVSRESGFSLPFLRARRILVELSSQSCVPSFFLSFSRGIAIAIMASEIQLLICRQTQH